MTSFDIGRASFVTGVLGAALVSSLATGGCGKSDDSPKVGNGVNDVHEACIIRTTWVASSLNKCNLCAASVVSPRCSCTELEAFSGACSDQQDARTPVCPQSVDDCLAACKTNDCACVDACYANNAACKQASDARDGCQADACTQYCK